MSASRGHSRYLTAFWRHARFAGVHPLTEAKVIAWAQTQPDETMLRWRQVGPSAIAWLRSIAPTTQRDDDHPRHRDQHGWECRVYWGSHGCDLVRGHDGPCICASCYDPFDVGDWVGAPPYYGPDTRFYGEDVRARGLPEVDR